MSSQNLSKSWNIQYTLNKELNSMTPLTSNKVHLFAGCSDIPKGRPWAFHFLKKVTYGFLDEAQKSRNLTFKVNLQCQKSTEFNFKLANWSREMIHYCQFVPF